MAFVARVDNGATVVRIQLPNNRRSRSRTRSRSRSRTASHKATKAGDLPVRLVSKSVNGEQLGFIVAGQPVVMDSATNTIETQLYTIQVQRIHDDQNQTVVDVTIAPKPGKKIEQPKPQGFFARRWRDITISILVAIILALLGGSKAKPCVVNVVDGFQVGPANAITELITPSFGFVAGFKFANLQMIAQPALRFFTSEVPNLFSNVLQRPTPTPTPIVAPSIITITKYVNVYNTKQDIARRELEALFSAVANETLYRNVSRLEQDVSGLQGALGRLQNTLSLSRSNVTSLRGTVTTMESTLAQQEAALKALETIEVNYNDLLERFETLTVTSAADLTIKSNKLIQITAERDRYRDVVVPALEKDLKESGPLVVKSLKSQATIDEQARKDGQARYERAESELLKLAKQKDVSRIDAERQLGIALDQLAQMERNGALMYSHAKTIDAIVLHFRQLGLTVPLSSESEIALRATLDSYAMAAGLTSDRLTAGLKDHIKFLDLQIAEIQLNENNDVVSALGASYREQLLRELKSARITALNTQRVQRTERYEKAGQLQAASFFKEMYSTLNGKYTALRAADRSVSENVVPTIYAERGPNGSYTLKDNVQSLLKIAPGLQGNIDELRQCLLNTLNGGDPRLSVPPQSVISCTTTTRLFALTGSVESRRSFNMNLLRTSDLAKGAAPIQNYEYMVSEQEVPQAPRIVTEIQVKTVVVREKTVDTVVTRTTGIKSFSPTPTSESSTTTALPITTLLTRPEPLTATVQKLVAATLVSGKTEIVSKTSAPRTNATPLILPESAPDGVVSMSKGSDGKGVFVLQVERTAVDVSDKAHPLSEYSALVDGSLQSHHASVTKESWSEFKQKLDSYKIIAPAKQPDPVDYYPQQQPLIHKDSQPNQPAPYAKFVRTQPRQIEEAPLPSNLSEWAKSFAFW